MKISREMSRMVRWLLVGLLVLQIIIVPWTGGPFYGTEYAPIFTTPTSPTSGFGVGGVRRATIDAGRLLLQLAVTGGLLLLWLRVAKPEE